LLTTVEPNYLQGLGSIVLSSQTDLSRKKRRQKNWRLGRKISTSQTLGYYQRAWNGKPAFIDLYIDKIFAEVPAWTTCFPMVAFFVISAVFFTNSATTSITRSVLNSKSLKALPMNGVRSSQSERFESAIGICGPSCPTSRGRLRSCSSGEPHRQTSPSYRLTSLYPPRSQRQHNV
jgi:hypothetical protein